MRIAYIAHWDVSRGDGVLKKIVSQMRAWSYYGNEVRLFAISPVGQIWEGLDATAVNVVESKRVRSSIFKTAELSKLVNAWQPDLTYVRFSIYYPSLERLSPFVPQILEINTDDIAEYKITFPNYLYLYHRLTRDRLIRKAHGLIFVTDELSKRFFRYHQSRIVIPNGIDLSQYEELPASFNDQPRLVFIGSAQQSWHGVDKILWLARYFPEWKFDLIGLRPTEVAEDIPSNIVIHGFLTSEKYTRVIASADVAIGTLALHRKKLDEACPLKVREYLAYGIPAIIGYRDSDFPRRVDYLLQLPNAVDNVTLHVSDIQSFVESWQGRRVQRREITQIDSMRKEKDRLSFFSKLIDKH